MVETEVKLNSITINTKSNPILLWHLVIIILKNIRVEDEISKIVEDANLFYILCDQCML